MNQLERVTTRPPSHQLNITMVYRSTDVKRMRDQHCLECGQPNFAVSDKVVAIYDGGATTEYLRSNQRTIEIRCKRHTCKQHYLLEV